MKIKTCHIILTALVFLLSAIGIAKPDCFFRGLYGLNMTVSNVDVHDNESNFLSYTFQNQYFISKFSLNELAYIKYEPKTHPLIIENQTLMKQVVFISMILLSLSLYSQSSTFQFSGRWGNASNWDNGVPNSSVNAIISANNTITNSTAECADLQILAGSSVSISRGDTLIVNGTLILPYSSGGISNEGTLILRGDYFLRSVSQMQLNGGLIINSSIETNASGGGIITAQ